MGNFYLDVIQQDGRFNSTERISDTMLLEPQTRGAVEGIITAAALQGIELQVFETYRSQARQALLFAQGASKLRTVGVHHYGLACDIVIAVAGEPSWKADYSILGKLAADQKLVWGGDWGEPNEPHSFRDSDHVQRIALVDQARLFAGTWYPEEDYVAGGVG